MNKKKLEYKISINKIKAQLIYQPSNLNLLNNLAGFYFNSNDYQNAIKYYEKIIKLNNNAITISNLALSYQLIQDFSKAISLFNESIELDPEYFAGYINLGSALSSIGMHDEFLKLSLKALNKWPKSPELHTNVGVALLALGHHKEARISLETALLLNENSVDALFNIASIESFEGNRTKAINIFEKLLENSELLTEARTIQIKHSLGFEYLNSGKLKKGWEYYEYGFSPLIPHYLKRNPNRNFSTLRWNGSNIDNKTLMIWGEQGIGDEILYSSLIPDLMKDVANLIIECEPRIVSILQRSFPNATIRSPKFDTSNENFQTLFDYDFQIPIGSLFQYYRKDIVDFHHANSKYIVTSKYLNEKYQKRLYEYESKLKIGIIWRSGMLDPLRNLHYTNILDWGVIFELNNIEFINLQYGECEEELIQAEKKFNKKIHRWNDVDLKNDLDDVISIIENLDLVIAPCTATAWLAAGVGKPTLVFQQKDWINLGQDYFPLNKNVKSFFPKQKNRMAETLLDIRTYIDQVFYIGN